MLMTQQLMINICNCISLSIFSVFYLCPNKQTRKKSKDFVIKKQNNQIQINPTLAHFKGLVKIMLYTEVFFYCQHMNNDKKAFYVNTINLQDRISPGRIKSLDKWPTYNHQAASAVLDKL